MPAATSDFDPNLPDEIDQSPTLDEVIRIAVEEGGLRLRVCQPARVTEVTGEQEVTVQPLLKVLYPFESTPVDLTPILKVPVCMPGGAGWSIKMPVAVGDVGWIMVADRSIDAFMASAGTDPVDPADTRQHHIQDAIFFPGAFTTGAQTQDGTTDLVLTNGTSQLRVRSDGKFQVKNDAQELLNLVDQLLQQVTTLINTTAASSTAAGGGPLLNAAAFPPIAQAVAVIQTNLATLKV